MASVLKRGKIWYVKYRNASGEQKMVKGYTDKKETTQLAYRLEDEKTKIQRGDFDPQQEAQKAERKRGIEEHIDAYAAHLDAGGRSDNHRAYTLADIRAFVAFAGPKTLGTVTRSQVDAWVLHLVGRDELYREWASKAAEDRGEQRGEPNSARTINRRVGSLQAILKWAHAAGVVGHYVLAKYPKREVRGNAIRESRPLDDAEVEKLLAWAKTNAPARHDIYKFALLSGARADECASLTPASFDLEHGTVTIHSKDPRHSDRIDVVPLHPELAALVKARIDSGAPADKPLFVFPDRQQAARLREDCTAAGVNPDDVTFHGLRHTFVTRLARRNVHPTITQKLARHRDIAMTLGYYTHWSTNDERAALALL
jgi:integrase